MIRIYRQNSTAIKEHLNELHRGLENSKNKFLLNKFIVSWQNKYVKQKQKELILNK